MKSQRLLNESLRKHIQSIKSCSSSAKSLVRALVKAREEINKSDYPALVENLIALNIDRLLFFPQLKRNIENIFRYKPIQRLALHKEIEWQFTYLQNYSKQIEKYIFFSKEVDESWLNNELIGLEEKITHIEDQLGKSLRLIEIKVSIWQELGQKDKIQEFFETVKNNSHFSGLATALIALVIERNEEEVYLPRFFFRMEKFLENADFVLANLIRFCIAHIEPNSDDGWASILSSVSTGGIVDAYESFFECCESKANQIIYKNKVKNGHKVVLSKEDDVFLRQIIRYATFFGQLGDERFEEILLKIKLSELLVCEFHSPNINSPVKVEFSEFIKSLCFDEFLNTNIRHYEFWNRFWLTGKHLIERTDNVEHEAYSLIKFSINNLHLRISNGLGYFGFDNIGISKAYSTGLSLSHINPFGNLYLLEINKQEKYLDSSLWDSRVYKCVNSDILEDGFSDSATSDFTVFVESVLIKLDLEKISIAKAINLLEAVPQKVRYLETKVNKMRFNEALLASDNQLAIEIACVTCVSNVSRTIEFGLRELVGNKGWDYFSEMSDSIIVPISLYLYLMDYEDPDAHFNLRLSIDEFLQRNNCATPSELLENKLSINDDLLVFFLDSICTNEYLEFVTCLNQTRLIEEERRDILKWLVVKNTKKRNEYEDEIKGISARLTVDDGLKEFDRSRVHVDLLGIYKWAEKNLNEDYDRLQTLIRTNSNTGIDAYSLLEKVILDSTSITREMFVLENTPVEAQTLKIIRIIFDQFNNNKPYGLDTHLSLRIRHGSFRGNIRSVLEVNGLISTKEKASGSYSIPNLWLTGMEDISDDNKKKIQKAFDLFGRNIDTEIDRYINQIIQIRSSGKNEGIFDIKMNELVVKVMSSSAVSGTSQKEFIDNCFLIYLSSLEGCLQAIREIIEREFKRDMVKFIAELEISLKQILNSQFDLSKERAIADGRKQLIDVIDKVRDWFTFFDYRSTSKLYTIEEMADVAIAAVGNARKGNNRYITKEIDDYLQTVKVMNLETIVDPLFILLENAEKYGDISSDNPIKLKIHIVENSKLRLFVSNKLKPETNVQELKLRLEKIAKEISNLGFTERLATEGGTGLVKLSRMGMLSRENETNDSIFFGIDESSLFFNASIDLDFKVKSIDE